MDFRYPDKPTEAPPEVIAGFKEADYISQCKYDGYRFQIYRDGGYHLVTRMGETVYNHPVLKKMVAAHPQLFKACESLAMPDGSVIDSELVGPRGNQKPGVYIFDCIKWNGEWLGRMPYEQRWGLCLPLQLPHPDIHLAETFTSGFIAKFEAMKKAWLARGGGMDLYEGIVVKWRQGRLVLSRNSSTKSNCMWKCKYRDVRTPMF
jgi:ATP-dependent DNA ligase